MKLSFSIQNWNKSWDEFLEVAGATHMQGIELYNIEGKMFEGKGSPSNPERAAYVRRELVNMGLTIPSINTVRDFTNPDFMTEFEKCAAVAVNLGIENIGIHTVSEDQELAEACVRKILEKVEGKPLTVLVETCDAYGDTARLRDLLNRFADDQLAALWDMHTTTVFSKEDAETTITNLGAYVRHVHIHDFRMEDGIAVPELIGDGNLPMQDLMNALRSVNYDGFVSLEWDPEYIPGLEDIEIILT
ncbi:MAG: TIM barrel protein, partial [Lachnospiraceae bacterium]|nr:TIM barrel protein [Lachnospiraceae bacterium]